LDIEINTAPVFEPLLYPSRYKGAWGGRGSGKSHFFAELLVERCLMERTEWVCIREVQKTLKDSAKKLIEGKIQALGVGKYFEVQNALIKTPHGGQIIFQGMQDHTAESIKSLEGFDGAWVEEAQTMSSKSLELLRPTIRKEGSELWFSWNPTRKNDPIETLMRSEKTPSGAVVIRANWSDNPWFPSVLEDERKDCLRTNHEQYDHIWEGDYKTIFAGAYYTDCLKAARSEGRIGRVAADPLMTFRAFWDIGGTGAKADACSIWIAQFIGREIRIVNHYTAQGQPLAAHINWLRQSGYDKCLCVLPHDGAQNDKVFDVSYESALRDAGFGVQVVPNQGKGAATKRIEAARRLFGSMWFNEEPCKGGLEALAAYHEKRDEERGIGMGPDHDWSSHDADSFGLIAVAHEPPTVARRIVMPSYGSV